MPVAFSPAYKSPHRTGWIKALITLILVSGILLPANAAAYAPGTIGATYEVNIRACANLDCPVIGAAKLGDAIEVTGEEINGFIPVTWFGREGFVFSLYLLEPDRAPWFVEGSVFCNEVALVFNIGIGDQPSQSILDTLVRSDTPATMFPMGWWALEHPDYLVALDEAGFVIGTHGNQPMMLTSVTDEVIADDLTSSVTTIESVLGREIDQYFTPYAADTDERVREVASELGLLPVGWNVTANDYGPDVTEADVYDRVMNDVYPGAIIEFHLDGPATEQSTALALPRIIQDLRAQGYDLVTVPDLIIPCEGSPANG